MTPRPSIAPVPAPHAEVGLSKKQVAALEFLGFLEQAKAEIDDGGLPDWLSLLQDDVASALAIAGVELTAQRIVLDVMLALWFALSQAPPLPGQAPPLPTRERQRERRNLRRAAKIMGALPREIDAELQTVVELPECDGCPEFEVNDPVGEARDAMRAVMRAAAVPRSTPKVRGRSFAPTSLAVVELVRIARSSKPDLDRAALTAIVVSILGAVMITVNNERNEVLPEPRWGERVADALAEDEFVEPQFRTPAPSPFVVGE